MDNTNRPADITANGTTIFTAPTLAALVDQMPVANRPAFLSNLNTSVEAYNSALAAGREIPFASPLGCDTVIAGGAQAGEVLRARHLPLGSGPFWAQRTGPFADIWGTNSGLNINQQGQVLNTAGTAIPNLYAAGEVIGWILPVQYGGSGMAITIWTNQARITGRAAGLAAR